MQNKDFTQLSKSEAITALNKEIQQKDYQIEWLTKQATHMRLTLQHLSGQQNIYPEAQLNCNSCG